MAVKPRNQRAVFWNIKGPRKTTLKRCPAELKVLAIISTKRQIYRPAQIESICRRQIKLGSKVEIFIRKGKKHYGKRRKCWLPAFSSFPTVFSKGFLPRVLKSRDCVAKIFIQVFSLGYIVFVDRNVLKSSGECRARSDCTYVQAFLALHSPQKINCCEQQGKG